MKIATWNVNSLKVRLGQLQEWLAREAIDVVCLQETKLEDSAFPVEALDALGYHSSFTGQKTYNGVAILSRYPAEHVESGIPSFDDPQKRVLSATICGVRVVCAYVPNGQSVDSDKYRYKLEWLSAFQRWLQSQLSDWGRVTVLGDFNIAPEDQDVHDPKAWEGQVLVSEAERAAFRGICELGFRDSFRLFPQAERSFTWWDYRMNAFRRKMGLRIDHILVSEILAPACRACTIETGMRALERPSDHAPVVAELALES
ncbi:MAG: exodeoxyribonuclease III [Betaproteobacteria bacterium]|nr:exodeoxyribonuclease III [Betaproteobacteria bacterium]